jgi:4-diphosphocytidyl-2-C-methyl-D-erythritol kinase
MTGATVWEAPAKLNLSLQVGPLDGTGLHPLRSLMQTIEWCDRLEFEQAGEDELHIEGADLPEGGDNLVWKAVAALRAVEPLPPLRVRLAKEIAVGAGLGGGSTNAAATLLAASRLGGLSPVLAEAIAPQVGSDVPFLMVGGTAWVEGYGEQVAPVRDAPAYPVVVVVPPFELETAAVYREWDRLESPAGRPISSRLLPPGLRVLDDLRNDLGPAARSLRPELADWMDDLEDRFERPVLMSGSGPALFAFFRDLEEAEAAAAEAPSGARAVRAAAPRGRGPAAVEAPVGMEDDR